MALLHVDFFSDVLGMCTSADVILPQQTSGQIGMEGKGAEGKLKTMYLLHGMSDDQTIWQYGIQIDSEPGKYTRVIVEIPARIYKEEMANA